MNPPLVFVVGSGRCGTHTLWRVFESLPELNAYLYHYAGAAVFQRTFALDEAMIAFMDRCFAGRANLIAWCRTHGIAYCDANPFAFNFISYIHRKFPAAKFMHLVRDGYECVRSCRGAI